MLLDFFGPAIRPSSLFAFTSIAVCSIYLFYIIFSFSSDHRLSFEKNNIAFYNFLHLRLRTRRRRTAHTHSESNHRTRQLGWAAVQRRQGVFGRSGFSCYCLTDIKFKIFSNMKV